MKHYEPGYYWIRYTRGPMRDELAVAERRDNWWFLARETSRSDQELEAAGIEVVCPVAPPPDTAR